MYLQAKKHDFVSLKAEGLAYKKTNTVKHCTNITDILDRLLCLTSDFIF